ncbi:MAG: cell division protein ZapA [bacterium]|nr:cell division protein ZapA [bacterium]
MEEKKEIKEVTLHIFGKDFFIQTDMDEEYTLTIAKYLSDEMKDIARNAGAERYEKIAVITAMNIVDKYLTLEKRYKEMEKRLSEILEKIK